MDGEPSSVIEPEAVKPVEAVEAMAEKHVSNGNGESAQDEKMEVEAVEATSEAAPKEAADAKSEPTPSESTEAESETITEEAKAADTASVESTKTEDESADTKVEDAKADSDVVKEDNADNAESNKDEDDKANDDKVGDKVKEDPFEKMISSDNDKEEKDSFDKMLTNEDDAKDKEEKKEDPFEKMLSKDDDAKDKEEKKEDPFEKMLSNEDDVKDKEEKKEDPFEKMLDNPDEKDKKVESETKNNIATTIASLDALEDDENSSDKKKNEDDVIDLVTSDKVLSDDKYYEELKAEELDYLKANMPTVDSFYGKLQCTICAKVMDPVIGTSRGVQRHPHLGISMCHGCRKFYGDGDWPRSEDGDEYCRMCGQGGDILLCDNCPNAFCKKCLQRNLGSRALREITKSENWSCLLCDSKPIFALKAVYYCLYKSQDEIKERREKDREKEKRKSRKSEVTAKEKEALIKSPQNFLEENISEAFKTLEVYQKSLETERTRCIKTVKEGMSVEMATSITRKLRKLYAVTQKNMDLLDRAIVESFVENFPTESTRIHMGRVAPNDPPTPVKRKRLGSSKAANKIKIKAKGKAALAKGKKKASKKVIRMNGAPVYRDAEDLVVPSLMGKKKKRRKNDSDIECLDVSDSEYYSPKKRMKAGPSSSKNKPGPASAKKKKLGPKSKTFY